LLRGLFRRDRLALGLGHLAELVVEAHPAHQVVDPGFGRGVGILVQRGRGVGVGRGRHHDGGREQPGEREYGS
jgi:hypothetical protein